MEKKLITKYRLVLVEQTTDSVGNFTLTLFDPTSREKSHDYKGYYRDGEEFDSHQEALDHAMNSEKWFQSVFTILPLYYVSEKY